MRILLQKGHHVARNTRVYRSDVFLATRFVLMETPWSTPAAEVAIAAVRLCCGAAPLLAARAHPRLQCGHLRVCAAGAPPLPHSPSLPPPSVRSRPPPSPRLGRRRRSAPRVCHPRGAALPVRGHCAGRRLQGHCRRRGCGVGGVRLPDGVCLWHAAGTAPGGGGSGRQGAGGAGRGGGCRSCFCGSPARQSSPPAVSPPLLGSGGGRHGRGRRRRGWRARSATRRSLARRVGSSLAGGDAAPLHTCTANRTATRPADGAGSSYFGGRRPPKSPAAATT